MMEDGQQQHQAIETAEVGAGSEAAAESQTAESQTAEQIAARDRGMRGGGAARGVTTPAWREASARAPQVAADRPTSPSSTRAGFLARPFARVTSALVAVCCFALIGVVYSITVLTGADWTRGAQVAAYAAFALALLALAGGALRAYAVRRRSIGGNRRPYANSGSPSPRGLRDTASSGSPSPRRERGSGGEDPRRAFGTLALALLLAVSLAGTGAAGLLVAPGLHRTQARVLEDSGRYEPAIAEYALAGDSAPSAPDTARTYDEWAASLLRQKQYAAALSRYLLVTGTYPGTGSPYHQAEAGVFATYTAWIAADGAGVPYPDAIAYIQSYIASAACDATCQSTATAILPRAAYQFGTQLIAAGQFAAAVKQLASVKAQYPQSQYAEQSHTAAAVAYLGLGKQQLPTACGAAIKTYQTLAKQYADTPQGAEAKQALAAPQPVTGAIAHLPSNPAPTIYLSRSADPGGYFFSNDFHTGVDAQSGVFRFASVPVGTYYLSAVRDTGAGTQTVWWNASDGSIYSANVSPLCGAHLPTFTYA